MRLPWAPQEAPLRIRTPEIGRLFTTPPEPSHANSAFAAATPPAQARPRTDSHSPNPARE